MTITSHKFVTLAMTLSVVAACAPKSEHRSADDSLGVAATASAPAPGTVSHFLPDTLCYSVDDSRACLDTAEASALKLVPGRATWDSTALTIRPSHGAPVVLTHHWSDDDNFIVHDYSGYNPRIDYFLARVALPESHEYLLIDGKTGKTYTINAVPVVSPDAQRLVVASSDMMAGFLPNVFEIYRVTSNGLTKEFDIDTQGKWGATHPRWASDSVIDFERDTLLQGKATTDNPVSWRKMRVTMSKNRWGQAVALDTVLREREVPKD